MKTIAFTGRIKITTSETKITRSNIVGVLNKAYLTHCVNQAQIEYLWRYYRGNQPILNRTKVVRPEINNKIVENRANEIVSFKVGYMFGDPIQYVGLSSSRRVTSAISKLNELMRTKSKASIDREIAEWMSIGGVGYRVVLPNEKGIEIASLDPRKTFVVYTREMIPKKILGVSFWVGVDGKPHFSCYTDTHYYEVEGEKVTETPHGLGAIPIIEYPANNARLGSFEIVLPLLDALNTIASNRVDGVEQFVQSFLKFINCDIDEEAIRRLNEMGGISVSSSQGMAQADVDFVSAELNQTQVQTLVDYTYQTILTVCGMPNRNGGSSTSDTGQAVILRDGWSLAEARAKDTETIFKKSETEFLEILLNLCKVKYRIDLKVEDVSIKFTRRNHEDIQTKVQVLTTMLDNPKIHPLLAFNHSDMFPDPEEAYAMSEEYYKQEGEKK